MAFICLLPLPQAARAAMETDAAGSRAEVKSMPGQVNVVVIDPGHGGEDSGAVGQGGAEEKNITLSVALRLAERLRQRLGCEVLLTRTDDRFVPLFERTAFANRNNADIFISIHANAAVSRDANGVETFFMSFDATDDDAMRVAAFENNAMKFDTGVYGEETGDLKEILLDLTKTESHHESSRLAEVMQASILKATGKEDRGVKQAPFVVLTGALMPAVLVEIGFISNPDEEKRLSSKKEQVRIADSIMEGVVTFRRPLAGKKEYVGYSAQAPKKN